MKTLGVGIIGAGNISSAYLKLAPMFAGPEVRAIADINENAANARAREFELRSESVEGLLAARDIDVVVNLTVPQAHFEVSTQALIAGKHVYSEKPFVLTVQEGAEIKRLAEASGLRVGSAPDTFLGGAHQQARALIDEGNLGRITSGTAIVMSHGMEHWHPNPDFFFLPGAGPMLDLGPYYVTNLVQLLGPVARVAAITKTPSKTRTITSEPRNGEEIPVKTPTTLHAVLEFASGAVVTLIGSWDVWGGHGHSPMELYGSKGTVFLPDPNFFAGDLRIGSADQAPEHVAAWDHPFSAPNEGDVANYRVAGLADMVAAISDNRPHRCSLELALHAVEVMTGVLHSGETGAFVEMTTTCERPAPLTPDEARALLA